MRFRTKLLLVWGGIVLLMLAGTLWPVQHTIRASFDHMTADAFAGTRRSLQSFQAERFSRMRQAGVLLMNIPELRALIAEENFEISSENLASLQERLDSLRDLVGANFICVLDGRATLIAQNHGSPWARLADVSGYVRQSPQAQALIRHLFSGGNLAQGEYGLWTYQSRLYQVVSVPLVFGQSSANGSAPPDGALIMATELTNDLAADLGRSHGCEITFLRDGTVLASSLPHSRWPMLLATQRQSPPVASAAFDMQLQGDRYRASTDPMIDVPSGTPVATMLIQSNLAPESALESRVFRSLGIIMLVGLAVAAMISFVLSGAVTRPVYDLVAAARKVAGGDLNVGLPAKRRDELGQLATAFNEMVNGLRRQRELERAAEQSQAASRAKSEFLASMSHEIRTPLHGVLGITDLLLRTNLSAEQQRFVQLINSSGQVLTTLINDLLDFSKIEAGKLELESIDFNLHQVMGDVVGLMALRAQSKGLDLRSEIAPDVPEFVRGDPTRLRQILLNLVSNAIKFTENGGVSIHALLRSRTDRITVEFEVRDTGIGIPADRLDRLFKSFSQVDASTTRRYGGTGLGLAISKQLADLMGGSIGVRSEFGHGSTFWFTVALGEHPTANSGRAERQTVDATIVPAKPGARILLAEDNQISHIVASELLRTAGYQCDVASNGSEAVEASATSEYDLILMDCQMPVMDGLQAARAIRQREQSGSGKTSRRVPIVALTADASGVARDQCREAGMDGYCSKPFRAGELLETIADLLAASCAQPDTTQSDKSASLPVSSLAATSASAAEILPPIDVEALLGRCNGKASLAVTLLEKFQTQVTGVVIEMTRLIEAGDGQQLARASHGLKGTAGIMAAESLREAVARLEEWARAGDFQAAGGGLDAVRQEVDRCNAFLNTACRQLAACEVSGNRS